jgi:hypothetical protein
MNLVKSGVTKIKEWYRYDREDSRDDDGMLIVGMKPTVATIDGEY